ncbi:MAG TPA: cytochrome c oxidase subunit 3 family protein [Blastocatellia bacterium]|nr:cytochrome c oxidase subunit 3 family protein [Blastocatellia bacterium]
MSAEISKNHASGNAGTHHPALKHHFADFEQQREAGTLGMWVFLVTEIMFFGGLFMTYIVYRTWHPAAFAAASHELDVPLGSVNTIVLIASSLTMALAVYSAQTGGRKATVAFLALTLALGLVFLGIKFVEYHHKFVEGHVPGANFNFAEPYRRDAQMFFSLYFAMTGVHALHMVVGVGILAVLIVMAWRGRFSPEYHTPVELSGLYWHFVDIIWIFLFPLLYLIGRHLHQGGL